MASPPQPRRRRWLRVCLGLGMATALTLGLLEVVLRVVDPLGSPLEHLRGFYRLDAQGRIETNPGWQGTFTVDGRTTAARTNRDGLRGPDLPEKAPGERRVLLLGDSFTWGLGVEFDEAIPAQLERLLRADAAGPVRVGNAGMWGTGPREWGYTLERHRATFQPDLVVAVSYLGNDVLDSLNEPLSVVDGQVLYSDIAHAMRSSWRWSLALRLRTWFYVEKLLARFVPPEVPAQRSLLPPGLDPLEALFLDVRPEHADAAPWIGPVLAVLREHCAGLRRAAGDLPVLVVLLPPHEEIARGRFAAQLQRMGLPEERFARGEGARRVAAMLTELGLPVLDLSPQWFAHPDPDSLCLSDWHYNAAGCAQVAAWIAPAVRASLGR